MEAESSSTAPLTNQDFLITVEDEPPPKAPPTLKKKDPKKDPRKDPKKKVIVKN